MLETNKQIWNSINMEESNFKESSDILIKEYKDLPDGLKSSLKDIYGKIDENFNHFKERYDIFKDTNLIDRTFGFTVLRKINESYEGVINITSSNNSNNDKLVDLKNQAFQKIVTFNESFNDENPCKTLTLSEDTESNIQLTLSPEYSKELYEYFSTKRISSEDKPIEEATVNNETLKEGKALLKTFFLGLRNKRIDNHTMNLLSKIVNKNFLKAWKISFNEVKFEVDTKRDNLLEFKIPRVTEDFVERFIRGRESINGFLHRKSTITIRISENVFKQNVENDEEFYDFIKRTIEYYDRGVEKYAEVISSGLMKADKKVKFLLSNDLYQLVAFLIYTIFTFDNVKITNKKLYNIEEKNIRILVNFIKSIFKEYKDPAKEKKAVIEDIKNIINNIAKRSENMAGIKLMQESIERFFTGEFNSKVKVFEEKWIEDQIDKLSMYKESNADIKYVTEKFGVKKLKKIPSDLIAYITIETECIRDANDKMMLASYTIGKIEIVEWYIQLLEVGSKKYLVQHTMPQLKRIHSQLLQCYKNIMAVKLEKKKDDTLIDRSKYPPGYEG